MASEIRARATAKRLVESLAALELFNEGDPQMVLDECRMLLHPRCSEKFLYLGRLSEEQRKEVSKEVEWLFRDPELW